MASTFLCFHEQILLNECPDKLKPVYYRSQSDDIFVLFRSPSHLDKFKSYLISKHKNVRLSGEKEQMIP